MANFTILIAGNVKRFPHNALVVQPAGITRGNWKMEEDKQTTETQKTTEVAGLNERLVMPVMWMIWDSQDGDEVVIRADEYVSFCKETTRPYWGFQVSILEFGKFRSEQVEVETYELNLKVEEA